MSIISNEARCTSCHAGYGWKDKTFDFNDKTKIDCLVCHDTTGTYKKVPTGAGMPSDKVDLVKVAKNVGHSSRATCGKCHFNGGGGEAIKHADLSRQLLYPSRDCDVHMGGYDFQCSYCHKTRNHRIAGRSSSVAVVEASKSCEDCHTSQPHSGNSLLDPHLNKHCKTIACNTCHSPLYAKCKPTKIWWDWSKAGDKKRKAHKDKYGMPDYHWKKGEFKWIESGKPVYAWFNGYTKRVLLKDKIDLEADHVSLSEPVGSINDPNAKITPFKLMKGIQGADAVYGYLLVPHLFPRGKGDKTAYWKNLDWAKAFAEGMKTAGIPYSGKYKWVETWMYWRVEHEVMPADKALGCVKCHRSLKGERSCDRCHQDGRSRKYRQLAFRGIDFRKLKLKGRDVEHLIDTSDYIDFKALGYKGDPIIYGGRFKRMPMGYKDGADK